MRQTTGIIILEFLTGTVLFVGMLLGLLIWRLMSGPMDIGVLKPQIESAITDARGGKPVTIGDVTLAWKTEAGEFQLIADSLVFKDEAGEEVGAAAQAQIDLNALSLLSGRVELSGLVLDTGELSIHRNLDGELRIAGQTIPPVYPLHFHEATSPLQYVEQNLLNVIENVTNSEEVLRLQRLGFRNFTIIYQDDILDTEWEVETAQLELTRERSELILTFDGQVYGEGAPERVDFNATLDLDDNSLSLALSFLNQSLPEAPILKLLPIDISGPMPGDATVQFEMDRFGIVQTALSVYSDGGLVRINDKEYSAGQTDFTAFYDVQENQFDFHARELDLGFIEGAFLLSVPEAQAWAEAPFEGVHDFTLNGTDISLTLDRIFERPLQFTTVDVSGSFEPARLQLDMSSFDVSLGDGSVVGNGVVRYLEDAPAGILPFGLTVSADTRGQFSFNELLAFWPVRLGGDARDWVRDNISNAEVSDARIRLNIELDSLMQGHLNDEDFQADFFFKDGSIRFLEDVPPLKNAVGSGQLKGNSFSVDLESGSFGDLSVTSGTATLSRFMPKGGDMVIVATGQGQVIDVLEILDQSRLQLSETSGMDISAASGFVQGDVTIRRPMLTDVSYEDTRFTVDAELRNGAYKKAYSGFDLTDTTARILIDNERLEMTGYGELAGTSIQFGWTEELLSEADDRTRLKASGIITPDLLNRFGVAVRAYITGDVSVGIDAVGPSLADLERVHAEFDLTNNTLDFRELGWVKQSGERAEARLLFETINAQQRTSFEVLANGMILTGNVLLTEAGYIDQITLNRLFLENQMDIAGTLSRDENGALLIDVDGPYLNGAPFVEGLMSTGGGGAAIIGDVSFNSRIDKLDLKDGFSLSDVSLSANFVGPDLEAIALQGETEDNGGVISLQLSKAQDGQNLLTGSASDAGGLIRGVFGMDFVTGGDLKVSGVLREGDEASNLMITIRDTRLKQAPLLTQILSLASLRGLSDVMSGDGVLFTNVTVPLRIDENGYYLEGVKASGPAMGLTANGYIKDSGSVIALDGVLVPSFGVNSALGGIPIVGDLFVSREGEGVFAITYTVRGSLEEARISVNPLSGLLPGVLRRIFENPADEPIPAPEETGSPEEQAN